ncbi:MAG: TetR/AcrR family transcriptional regulator [Proteobacteria bacterium]|nr:TetR/AcrR family transcriptional regulator [Pseudomonadota bacterium]
MTRSRTVNPPHSGASLEAAVIRQAREHPQRGQGKAAEDLNALGYAISTSGVRYIWRKHGLETTYKRLKALEAGADGAAHELTAAQKELLRRGDVTRKLARKSRQGASGSDSLLPDQRRSHILLGAAELFVRHGYSNTSIRDIARQAGLLPGSVYHYFPAKEDLFIAVHREGFRQLISRVEDAIRQEKEPWRKLELACAAHIEAAVGDNSIHKITGTGLFSIHEQGLQRRLKEDRERYDQLFRQLVRELELPRAIDQTLFRLSLLGAVNWARVWYRTGKKTPRDIARAMIAIFRGQAMTHRGRRP